MSWPRGFRVGHHTDLERATGCTVILPPPGSVGARDVRGGGASTSQSDLLAADVPFGDVTALLLTGGSALGLAATAGVVEWCQSQGLGYDVEIARVPIVPTAVIFDLGIGGGARHPGPADGAAACEVAVEAAPASGCVGAGTGATVGKLFGRDGWCKGGLGSASAELPSGARVAALAVVNAFGDVIDERGQVLAGAWAPGVGFVDARLAVTHVAPTHPRMVSNTTLVVIMTDARLTKPEAAQVSRLASSGMARAIAPVHTPIDGDVAFVLSAGEIPATAFEVGTVAATLTASAIRDAVRSAASLRGVPAASARWSTRRPRST